MMPMPSFQVQDKAINSLIYLLMFHWCKLIIPELEGLDSMKEWCDEWLNMFMMQNSIVMNFRKELRIQSRSFVTVLITFSE